MHPTLARQLRRLCGIEAVEDLAQRLELLAQLPLSENEKNFVAGLHELFQRVDSTYEQNDRDLDLRSRSLEESSSELNAINDRMRNQLQSRNRVLQSVRDAAYKLLDQNDTYESVPNEQDLEGLSSLLPILIEQQEQRRLHSKRMSEKIIASEKQYRTLVEGLRDVIFKINEAGSWVFVNPAWHIITAHTIEETIAQNFLDFVHHDDIDKVFDVYTQLSKGSIDHAKFELRMLHKNKQICWFECTLMREIDELEHNVYFTGTLSDITERRRIAQMQTEFVSVVSHELRTPLTSIRGSLGILESGKIGVLSEGQLKLIQIANKNSQRLATLVNDILDMEKLTAGKMDIQSVSINMITLVEQAMEANQAYAHTLETSLCLLEHPTQAHVLGDHDRLMQVLANLISNACKFSPKGHAVELRIQNTLNKNNQTQNAQKSIRVSVQDHGPGIPEEFRHRIFNAFAQADSSDTRKQGGTGLGLKISKTLVEQMGGTMSFDTEINSGTCFWFELPCID